VDGNINSRKYIEILDNNLWPVISTRKDIGSYKDLMLQSVLLGYGGGFLHNSPMIPFFM
jgi:hypothetical protein